MCDKEKTAVMLNKYRAILPKDIHISSDVTETMLSEFVDSATFHIEQLEWKIVGFEAGHTQQDDFVTTTQRILHNIKGEVGKVLEEIVQSIGKTTDLEECFVG